MLATSDGISLSRVEATALLAFAGQEEKDVNKWGVNFRMHDGIVTARATNGFASFRLKAKTEATETAEWMVGRKFIVDAQKLLEGKQVMWLKFDGKSLYEAVICENDKKLEKLTVFTDAAIPQFSFTWEGDEDIPGGSRRKIANCSAVSLEYLKLATLAGKAVGVDMARWYAPADEAGPLTFTVGHDQPTSGFGVIKQLPANTAANQDDDEEAA